MHMHSCRNICVQYPYVGRRIIRGSTFFPSTGGEGIKLRSSGSEKNFQYVQVKLGEAWENDGIIDNFRRF